MANRADLRIGSWGGAFTADAGGAATFHFPAEFTDVSAWTAVLGETSLTTAADGLDVTVTFPAEVLESFVGKSVEWTLYGDGIPVLRDTITSLPSGTDHGVTTGDTTIVVRDVDVEVTALGPPGPPGNGMFFIDADGYVTALVPSAFGSDSLAVDDDGLLLLTIGD